MIVYQRALSFLFYISLVLIFILVTVATHQYIKEITSPSFTFSQTVLNYERLGQGKEKLLFLHGLVGSKNYWKRNLEKLYPKYDILLVDLLGFGDSPKVKGNYSFEEHLDSILTTLKKNNFSNDLKIIAHSMGSLLSIKLALTHPKLVKSLILIATPLYTSPEKGTEQISNASPIYQMVFNSVIARVLCLLHPLLRVPFFAKFLDVPEDVYLDGTKHNWPSYQKSIQNIIFAQENYANIQSISKKIPVKIIHGYKDKVAPIEKILELKKEQTPANFILLKDYNHQLFLENPSLVWDLL